MEDQTGIERLAKRKADEAKRDGANHLTVEIAIVDAAEFKRRVDAFFEDARYEYRVTTSMFRAIGVGLVAVALILPLLVDAIQHFMGWAK